ncbi:MAG TPA: hypothetical protein VEV87_02855 [Chitinophagaceae bacterium]|nr:hypothetical protein [Chitinophagaceae bacterium]
MEDKTTLDIIVDLLGLGILIWLLTKSLIDMVKGNKERKVFHNLLIVAICVIYTLKILLKDLLGVV